MVLKGDVAETDLRIDREAALMPPSDGGTYSATNIRSEGLVELRSSELRARVETALRETGIGSALILARIEAGAEDRALERAWLAQDLRAIAEHCELDPTRDDHRALAEARHNEMHVDLGIALAEAGVLRTDGVEEVDALDFHYDAGAVEERCQAIRAGLLRDRLTEAQVADQADAIEDRACAEIAAEQRDWIERMAQDAVFPATPSALYHEAEDGTLELTGDKVRREVQQGVGSLLEYVGGAEDVAGTIAASLAETFPTMPDHLARGLGQSYATAYALRMAEVAQEAPHGLEEGLREEETTVRRQDAPRAAQGLSHGAGASPWAREVPYPEIDRVVARRRDERTARIFDDDVQRRAFRREVEEALGFDAVTTLRSGDASALAPVLDDRTDQLRAALAYLKSEPDSAVTHGHAIRNVIDELVKREIDAERLVHGHTHRQGLTH
jgi:type IV secretion system T-DNA border endonuclease VirD2